MRPEKEILDFLVVGAQKAGTTSLFHYLKGHPELALPAGKEVPYFSHDSMYERGWSAYMTNMWRYEAIAGAERRWGTITPQYMVGGVLQSSSESSPEKPYDELTVPKRIRRQLPDARVIAILRDPVARAVSHHRMAVRVGHERRSFDEAVAELLAAAALQDARSHPQESTGYIAWGEYGRILQGYFDVFPREQMLVVFTEDLERDPARLLRRIQAFIGVSADFEPENLGQRFRVGSTERAFSWTSPSSWMSPSSPLSPQGLQRALSRSSTARAAWHAIPQAHHRRLRRPYERVALRVALRNRRGAANEVKANAAPSASTLASLREHYARDGEQLAALLEQRAPWQPAAAAASAAD